MGNLAWMICKMSLSCCSTFFSGACINFWALVYFSKSACIFSKRSYFQSSYIFKVLILSKHLYFQSAHIFKALIFSERFHIFMAFSFYFLSKRFYLFLFVSQRLFIFFFQEHYSALTLISGCAAHNFLIML